MLYLCPKHIQQISSDPGMAITLWHGAMENGVNARNKNDWSAARGFFGTAFETASLHLQSKTSRANNEFTLQHLLQASHYLSDVLQQLNLWEEAQVCLLTVQNRLLKECNHKTRTNHSSPEQLLNKTQRFVEEITTLFDFAGDETGFISQPDPTDTEPPSQEILIASAFYLMSRYALKPSDDLRLAVVDHLRKLFNHCEEAKNPILKNTYRRICRQWQQITKTGSEQQYQLTDEEFDQSKIAKQLH